MIVDEVRNKYLSFFKSKPRNHTEVKPAPLVLPDDPTTLFTSSGMQPLVPYLLGEEHSNGKRLVNSQPAIRLQDIDEVGDYSHTTFFEMLGNWSLGDYFKEEQLAWFWEFITKNLNLPKERLWVSVFEGNNAVARDEESAKIWRKLGVSKEKIFYYGVKENWWSRTGTPKQMPIGDIGGPDSEVFFEFPQIKHNKRFGKECHPACGCGRYLEIGNSVFMQYKKVGEDKLEELPNKNVDFGGGLERLTAATINSPDVFNIDVLMSVIKEIEIATGYKYEEKSNKPQMRVIADHVRASVFLIKGGVEPSNKLQGYVLRRLIRRSVVKLHQLGGGLDVERLFAIADRGVLRCYDGIYFDRNKDRSSVREILGSEADKFTKSLDKGLRRINTHTPFDLFQSYGFPPEITEELLKQSGKKFDWKKFNKEKEKHIMTSRSASKGQFKGGLSDHNPDTIKLHTATHLLLASLRTVLGDHVVQKGQNINKQRSRFDFNNDNKLTEDELKKVEDIINENIEKNLPVNKKKMEKTNAEKTGAIHAFGEKYGDEVSVYYVGEDLESAFSKEFCGGPHVQSTSEIGRVKIKKQEKIGAGLVRIYLEREN